MVTGGRVSVCMVAVLVSIGSIAGCGDSRPSATGTSSKIRANTPIRPVMPSPVLDCAGIAGLATVQSLVHGGGVVALVAATITDPPGPVENASRLVPVEKFSLLAGELSSGPVKQLEESAANEKTNILQPGSYLLPIGMTSQESTYFLSNGIPFVVDGDNAYESCPNFEDPDNPVIIRAGVTSIQDLTSLFAEAMAGR